MRDRCTCTSKDNLSRNLSTNTKYLDEPQHGSLKKKKHASSPRTAARNFEPPNILENDDLLDDL